MSRPITSPKKGVATVELAIVLPVLLVLIFGSIEICQRLYTKQSVVISAYEACRVATRKISDTAAVQTRCEELLAQQDVQGAAIEIRDMTHGQDNLDAISAGDEIRIRITVPWSENVISRYVIADQGSFVTEAYMLRE